MFIHEQKGQNPGRPREPGFFFGETVVVLALSWSDATGIRTLEKAMANLGSAKVLVAGARALNRAGSQGKTMTGRALVKQTGLKRTTVVAAMRPTLATVATLEYRIDARGGDIALKYFGARETRKGVSANPFNKRRVFDATFMKAGWVWPKRVVKPNWNGHVFMRTGKKTKGSGFQMDEFARQKSGVILPREMVRAESGKAWQTTVARVLPQRMGHELRRLGAGALD